MTKEQYRKHEKICFIIAVTVAAVLTVHMVLTTIRGNQREAAAQREHLEQTETQQGTIAESSTGQSKPVQQVTAEPKEETPEKYKVFDTMSADWGDEAAGFVFYEIPEEYKREGGYFPEKMQIYTYCLCKQYGVKYELVIALIERESGYEFDCVGDDGASLGYMQINQNANREKMEELSCTDLLNPYQNVHVGIDILAGLIDKYGTMQDALACYNYGERGAKKHLWSKGIYMYSYNTEIMQRMREIEEELRK